MWTSILCAWDQVLFSTKGSFWFIPGSFYQTVLYFSHAGASKTEKMQVHFKFLMSDKFMISMTILHMKPIMLLKLNKLQKSLT
jgi:hypothetical protein